MLFQCGGTCVLEVPFEGTIRPSLPCCFSVAERAFWRLVAGHAASCGRTCNLEAFTGTLAACIWFKMRFKASKCATTSWGLVAGL